VNFQPVFSGSNGRELKLPELATTDERYRQLSKIQGLSEHVGRIGVTDTNNHAAVAAARKYPGRPLAHRRIGRSEERGY